LTIDLSEKANLDDR